VPLFCRQIRDGGPVTVTDERMTRFVMTIDEAADLVVSSMLLARGGEVFVTKMPVVAIADLAKVMIDLVAPVYGRDPGTVEVRIVGPRPGEKLWEELSTDEESGRLLEGDEFLIVLPALATAKDQESYVYPGLGTARRQLVYHSDREPRMSKQAIRELLLRPGVLPADVRLLLEHEPT
jgi:FlaA1/EpsC-like NDP-sugar epimerase